MKNNDIILPDRIKSILSKYYDGQTTIEEERQLKDFFAKNDIPFPYTPDLHLLAFSNQESNAILPNDILWNKIKAEDVKRKRRGNTIKIISSAAASILVIFSISLWYQVSQHEVKKFASDTYSNPKEAYMVAQKYLGLVSNKLSYACAEMKPIEKLSIPTEAMKSFNELNQGFQHLNQLNNLEKPTKRLKQFSIIADYIVIDDKIQTTK